MIMGIGQFAVPAIYLPLSGIQKDSGAVLHIKDGQASLAAPSVLCSAEMLACNRLSLYCRILRPTDVTGLSFTFFCVFAA
jgi:hypothetical protein